MSKFESLTKYLPLLQDDNIGTWIIDHENDGSPEHPIQMPFVNYSEMVHQFIKDVYEFNTNSEDFELTRYRDILEKNGLEWGSKSMSEANVSTLNGQCVMALIMGVLRADRFCEGTILSFFKSGTIRKWLERLKQIDETTV